jgi:SAM-dependent methyltransferase
VKKWVFALAVRVMQRLPLALRAQVVAALCEATARTPGRERRLAGLFAIADIVDSAVDRGATEYEGGIHPKHRLTQYHRFFCDRISANDRVLDIGCGHGEVANSMAETGANVTGVDLNPDKIRRAAARYTRPNLCFVVGDATRALPDGTYDVVVLSNVLEHLDDRVGTLLQVRKATHAQRWLFRVPMINRDWRVPLRRELGLFYMSDATHSTEYTPASLREELTAAGLRIQSEHIEWGEIWVEARTCGA